jgi:hypothetical protein
VNGLIPSAPGVNYSDIWRQNEGAVGILRWGFGSFWRIGWHPEILLKLDSASEQNHYSPAEREPQSNRFGVIGFLQEASKTSATK